MVPDELYSCGVWARLTVVNALFVLGRPILSQFMSYINAAENSFIPITQVQETETSTHDPTPFRPPRYMSFAGIRNSKASESSTLMSFVGGFCYLCFFFSLILTVLIIYVLLFIRKDGEKLFSIAKVFSWKEYRRPDEG